MVTKSKSKTGEKKGKVKVGKLKLNKETVKELRTGERKEIRGGVLDPIALRDSRMGRGQP